MESAIAMPNTFIALFAHFVHFGGSIASSSGRWSDRHADGTTRTPRCVRGSGFSSLALPACAQPVHVPTRCRPLDGHRKSFSNSHEPNSCVSASLSFGLPHAMTGGEYVLARVNEFPLEEHYERYNESEVRD